MLPLPEKEIKKRTRLFVKESLESIEAILTQSQEVFSVLFSGAKVKAVDKEERHSAMRFFEQKSQRLLHWVEDVYAKAIICQDSAEPPEQTFEEFRLPENISQEVVECLLRIFTCGRELRDADFYFLAEVTGALNLPLNRVQAMVEQAQYEIRKLFFTVLLQELDEEQSYKCAVLLMKAVVVDDHLHPAEMKYLENISQMLRYNQSLLIQVEAEAKQEGFPPVRLSEDLANFMLRYLTEIVMCDGEYEPRESAFIKGVGAAFGYDPMKLDEVIQPVAAALMVKAALFPRV